MEKQFWELAFDTWNFEILEYKLDHRMPTHEAGNVAARLPSSGLRFTVDAVMASAVVIYNERR